MTLTRHTWHFFRAGGFDQPLLESGEDLRHLHRLDQKLWVALACPTRGLHFDSRTLELLDADGDGQIRAPELLDAIDWALARLTSAEPLGAESAGLTLADIDPADPAGRRVLVAARRLAAHLGKKDHDPIEVADAASGQALIAAQPHNGDGVVTPASAEEDAAASAAIADIVACLGGVTDRSGATGIDAAMLARFFADTARWLAWSGACPENADSEALAALAAVRAKIDDYFLRCRLTGFDPRAAGVICGQEDDYLPYASRDMSAALADLGEHPLAVAHTGQPLPLGEGVNPAWRAAIDRLRAGLLEPRFGKLESLSEAQWRQLLAELQPALDWFAARPDTPVRQLGEQRLLHLAAGDLRDRLQALIAADLAAADEYDGMAELEKLARHCRDLLPLANNFVAFRDFYRGTGDAIFQAGTLYLDGRSCRLTLRVDDIGRHATLAHAAGVCLVYCDCRRGEQRLRIAAAFTAGDADFLAVGRHGVFYDRDGKDWIASVTRIVDHPISLRQAFLSPYKRIGAMIGEQLQKIAGNKAKAVEQQAAGAALAAGDGKPPPFDIARFAGVFAAIGLAVGAIGTALVAVLAGFFDLAWWQMPLAVAGVALLISGPSVLIALFKLRRRCLAPALDACGWAINARARLNIPFGTSLTGMPDLPPGAIVSTIDPWAERRQPWAMYLFVFALLAFAVWAGARFTQW